MTTAAPDPLEAAQGVRCAGWALAFNHGWARCIVEQPVITPVPHAPAWLHGAMAFDGRIIPVIDPARYIDPAAGPAASAATMALVGASDDAVVALLFSGTPAQVRPVPGEPPDVPAVLAPHVLGRAVDAQGQPWALIDAPALTQAWSATLALA